MCSSLHGDKAPKLHAQNCERLCGALSRQTKLFPHNAESQRVSCCEDVMQMGSSNMFSPVFSPAPSARRLSELVLFSKGHPTSKLAFRCLSRSHQPGNLASELLMWNAAQKARYAARSNVMQCLYGRKRVAAPHLSLRLVVQQQLPRIFQLGFLVRQGMKRDPQSRDSQLLINLVMSAYKHLCAA